MRRTGLVPAKARRLAVALAVQHLDARQRAETIPWLRDPHRSALDISAFIDRMRAAHPGAAQ